jgi:hypothetical protein
MQTKKKATMSWVLTCRFMDRYQRFGLALKKETMCFSKTLVLTYESTRHRNPDQQHSMKIAFWDIAPCGLVEENRRFRGTYYLHH